MTDCSRRRSASRSESASPPGDLEVAITHDDEQRGSLRRPQEVTKQQEGRVVGPVHVVENHHDRLRSRDPGEQRGEHLEQSVALGLSLRLAVGEADDHRIARRGNRHLGQSTDELRKRVDEVGLKTMERFAERRWGARGDVRTERLDDRLVRHDRFFVTTPVEHDGTVRVRVPREFAHEARLADTGLAGDQRDLPRTISRLRPRAFERIELNLAAGKRLVVRANGVSGRGSLPGKASTDCSGGNCVRRPAMANW